MFYKLEIETANGDTVGSVIIETAGPIIGLDVSSEMSIADIAPDAFGCAEAIYRLQFNEYLGNHYTPGQALLMELLDSIVDYNDIDLTQTQSDHLMSECEDFYDAESIEIIINKALYSWGYDCENEDMQWRLPLVQEES